jgi:hypothetical protein
MRKAPYIMIQKKRGMWNIGRKKDTEMCFQAKRSLLFLFHYNLRMLIGRRSSSYRHPCQSSLASKPKTYSSEMHYGNIFKRRR